MISGRTEFIGVEWGSRAELVEQLNRHSNEGWVADSHRISSDNVSGWTIYRRYVHLKQPLLERSINVGELYQILNRVLEPGSEKAHDFDAAIKKAVRQEGDENV